MANALPLSNLLWKTSGSGILGPWNMSQLASQPGSCTRPQPTSGWTSKARELSCALGSRELPRCGNSLTDPHHATEAPPQRLWSRTHGWHWSPMRHLLIQTRCCGKVDTSNLATLVALSMLDFWTRVSLRCLCAEVRLSQRMSFPRVAWTCWDWAFGSRCILRSYILLHKGWWRSAHGTPFGFRCQHHSGRRSWAG